MGETNDPTPIKEKTKAPIKNEVTFLSPDNYVQIPLLDIGAIACCGCGNDLQRVIIEAAETISVEKRSISTYNDLRHPFAIRTEGDSMEPVIPNGANVVVNPSEEIRTGDAALVCYRNRWMVRGILFHKDKTIELKAKNPAYDPIIIDQEAIDDPDWFEIQGKIVSVIYEKRLDPMF